MDIFQEEGYNQCLSLLKEMGYPEQAAQQALQNIEFPDVSRAINWLDSHPEVLI